jgi:hypothetical protein
MATIRVLGQSAPSASIETVLYTCGATSTVVSSLFICNTSPSAMDSFSVRVCINGAGDAVAQILFAQAAIPPTTTAAIVAGLTLATGDVLKVTSTNGTTSFSLFGQENA